MISIELPISDRLSAETVEAEIAAFADNVTRFRAGQVEAREFQVYRLHHGIYGQRQPDVHMVRVKIPGGHLNAAQVRALGDVARDHGSGRGHFTTRENCQFHYVPLEEVPVLMRRLAEADLTTREGCGNVVRNVTGCALAGDCPAEAFDITPYAKLVTRAFLRHPEFQELPRKFKIAFSGCEQDCGLGAINDIGLIARTRTQDGELQRGFKVMVGGGLGSLPTAAAVISEFLPADDLVAAITSILRVFNAHGERANRMKARLKFVLRGKGAAELRRLILAENPALDWDRSAVDSSGRGQQQPEQLYQINQAADSHQSWRRRNVWRHPETGKHLVWINLNVGTLTVRQFYGLADLLEAYPDLRLRVAPSQNMVLLGVESADLGNIGQVLDNLELVRPVAGHVSDVTSCPGTTTCNIGITRSQSMGEELTNVLASERDPELSALSIKISGCPNSCGQHHIADIGFYGKSQKVNGVALPYYLMMLGGGVGPEGAQFGVPLVSVPARQVPQALLTLFRHYQQHRLAGEGFRAFCKRVGSPSLKQALQPVLDPTLLGEAARIDWGETQPFALAVGEGECSV